jgi:uncharacterized protein
VGRPVMSMIIDAHAHLLLHGFGAMKPSPVEAVVEHFARCGVEQVWYSSADALIQNQTDLHRRSNDTMAELQERFPGQFVGLATVNPREGEGAAAELERAIVTLGLRGLKIHGWLQPVSCTDACLEPLLEVANRLRLIVLFHDGTPPYTSSLQIAYLAERYPRCFMILGHGGLKDLVGNAAQAVRRQPNLYMQTVGTTLLGLSQAIEVVGPERILYGSDGGFGDLTYIDYNLCKMRKWVLPPEQEAMIMGQNARELLRRSGPSDA